MKVIALVFFTITALLLSNSSFAGDHQEGKVIVILFPGKEIKDLISKHAGSGNLPTELRVSKELSKAMNIWLLDFNTSLDENALLRALREDKDVAAAQFNYFFEPRNIPDDSLFPQQWSLSNTGQSGGKVGADIDALKAWNITTGGLTAQGDTIVIAIIDCGFDLTHEDLNFWKNYKEIPGNGIDDDGNGYIDDYNGWSASGNDTIPICNHGTHVAGIAGARGDNKTGIAGVNWNVQLMPLYYFNATDADVVICYGYAYQMRKLYNETNKARGAFIVATNSSFGLNRAKPVDHPIWCAMYDSLGSVGILSAAAGPDLPLDVDTSGDIPTTCPSDWLIGVTNTTNTDHLNGSDGWGAINIDLGAPGTNILSTFPDNQYVQMTGTSMASPHVAGAIALMWAAACEGMVNDYKNNPSSLALVMKNIMLNNVDTLPDLEGKTVSGGRLNLYKSLLGVQSYCKKYPQIKPFSFLIYPNPAVNTASIDFLAADQPVTCVVTDMLGRNIAVPMTIKTAGLPEYETIQLDLTGISAGIYNARLTNRNNASYGEILIKTK